MRKVLLNGILARPAAAGSRRVGAWDLRVRCRPCCGFMKKTGLNILLAILLGGCAIHREPPAPTYPPVPEGSVQILPKIPKTSKPAGIFVCTVTIQQERSLPIEKIYAAARKIASEVGANILYLKGEQNRKFLNGDLHWMNAHVIAFTAVRSADRILH
jgi:hypothetical protein